jgi:holo-[acyl-carrier protein] synthase
MIQGIGTDILEIERIKNIYSKYGTMFCKKILSEQEYINFSSHFSSLSDKHKYSYLAKRFSAKESIVKALGVGFGSFCSFKDIEIVNDDFGKPNAIISENVKKKLSMDLAKIHLSISDERYYVISYAVVEK